MVIAPRNVVERIGEVGGAIASAAIVTEVCAVVERGVSRTVDVAGVTGMSGVAEMVRGVEVIGVVSAAGVGIVVSSVDSR